MNILRRVSCPLFRAIHTKFAIHSLRPFKSEVCSLSHIYGNKISVNKTSLENCPQSTEHCFYPVYSSAGYGFPHFPLLLTIEN